MDNTQINISSNLKHSFLSVMIIGVVIIALSVFMFSLSMSKPVGHDEHMYCTAAYLTAKGELIYRDYSYVAQLPFHPLMLGMVYKITSTDHYLLTARLLSVVFEIGILVCISGIFKVAIKDDPLWSTILAILVIITYSLNIFVLYAVGFAWNHSMVLFCILLSLWLFLGMDFSKVCVIRLIITGMLLSTGTFTRPTTIFVLALFFFSVFVFTKDTIRKKLYCVFWFFVGCVFLAIWPISVILRAPKAFWLNTLKIPILNAQFLKEVGTVYEKSELTFSVLQTPSYLIILTTMLVIIIGLFVNRKSIDIDIKRKSVFSFLLVAVMIFIVYVPPTMWLQYWAMPVGFILVSLVYPIYGFMKIKNKIWLRASRYLIIACAIVSLIFGSAIKPNLFTKITEKDSWVPVKVHEISKDIVSKSSGRPILTMSPLYAIEGGGKIFTQFSAGPFVYRVADELSDSEKEIVIATGFDDIGDLIKNAKPNAVILGTEPSKLEEPIKEHLADNQWQVKGYGQGQPVLYFRSTD